MGGRGRGRGCGRDREGLEEQAEPAGRHEHAETRDEEATQPEGTLPQVSGGTGEGGNGGTGAGVGETGGHGGRGTSGRRRIDVF